MLHTFESIPEYIKAVKVVASNLNHHIKSGWTGNVSFEEAMDYAIKGDNTNVPKAMELLDKLTDTIPPTKTFKVIKSPYGGRCNFGDWQAGAPLPMRRRIRAYDDAGPLKIVVSTTSSMGIKTETMEKRGITILALLLRLQEIRPVDLYLFSELYGSKDGWSYQLIKMESRPLDLSVVSFCLSNVGFARQLTYSYSKAKDNFEGSWPTNYHDKDYAISRRQRLSLADSDMVIGEVHMADKLVNTPIEWLKEQIEKYSGEVN